MQCASSTTTRLTGRPAPGSRLRWGSAVDTGGKGINASLPRSAGEVGGGRAEPEGSPPPYPPHQVGRISLPRSAGEPGGGRAEPEGSPPPYPPHQVGRRV